LRSRCPQRRRFSGPGREPKAEEFALSDLMSSYWVNFAKSGDPNGPGLPKWPAFSTNEQNAMIFDSASSARPLPNLEKLKAFDSYYAWRRAQAKEKAGAPK
jgi:para-nitrobenzyl esterase